MESGITTSSFSLDRKTYAKAKIGFVLKKVGFPISIAAVLCLMMMIRLHNSQVRLIGLCVIGAMSLFLLAIIDVTLTRIYGRKFRHLLDAKRTIELSDSIVRLEVERLGESTLSWEVFSGAERVGTWTFLMQDRTPALAIPDHAFRSEGDLQAFRDLMVRKRADFRKR